MKTSLLLYLLLATSRSPTKAVLLSLLIPGGGQFYTGHYIKGLIIGGLETYLGYLVYREHQLSESEEHYNRRNTYLFYLTVVVGYSAMDAYVSAHFYGYREEEKLDDTQEVEGRDSSD